MKRIIVLGSSGSVGIQTLDIVSKLKSISVIGLSVNKNVTILKEQIKKFKPKYVCVKDFFAGENLKKWLKKNNLKINVLTGESGLEKLAGIPYVDMLVAAIVGFAGLKPVLKAIESKKDVALANKEVLVAAGKKLMALAKKNGVQILPVDSEHSAIFQCILGEKKSQIKKLILTASGGPFYRYKKNFSEISIGQALAHPTWKMGRKITIDSATLMNKGLEAIEASVLFDMPIEKVEIVIHPQSIIHSMVEYVDGSIAAHLSNPDMRLPIQYALTYPERLPSNIKRLNLYETGRLEFYKPDFKKFPCLKLAYLAAQNGGTFPTVLSASNEIAVAAFLDNKIKFTDISKIVEKTLCNNKFSKFNSLKNFIKSDILAREYAKKLIDKEIK